MSRNSDQPTKPSPVRSQRRSSVDRRSPSLGQRHGCCCRSVFTGFEHSTASSLNCSGHRHRAFHGTAPRTYVADLPMRSRLQSSTSRLLNVRPSWLVTVGDRSFFAAGPRLWNSLPEDVQSAWSLTTFRRKLKLHLFRQSHLDIILI